MSDQIVWWVGAAVIWSVGAIGATALIVGANALILWSAIHYARRFGNVNRNLHDMRAWVANGKPQFRQVDGRFVMRPTDDEARSA